MNHMVSFGTYATLPVVDVRRFFCLPFLCLKPIRYCQIFPTGNMDKQGNREETDRTMNGTFEAYKTVAFDIIREQLADLANSAEAREMARGLVPCMEEGELRRSMRDTTQARQMLELAGTPPMPAMEHTAEFVARSVRGELLTPEEMEEIGYEDCFYGDGVCLIEWSSLIEEILPKHVIEITIEKNMDKGFDYRKITVEGKE